MDGQHGLQLVRCADDAASPSSLSESSIAIGKLSPDASDYLPRYVCMRLYEVGMQSRPFMALIRSRIPTHLGSMLVTFILGLIPSCTPNTTQE